MRTKTIAMLGAVVIGSGVNGCHETSGGEAEPATTAPARLTRAQPSIGWLYGNCLAVNGVTLSVGIPVYLAIFTATPSESPAIKRVQVDHELRTGEPCSALASSRQGDTPRPSLYIVSLPQREEILPELAIVVRAMLPVSFKNGRLDLDGDGTPERFAVCAGSEGINYSVWSGAPYRGTRVWSDYYYLGYDLEPDCPEGAASALRRRP